MKILFFTVSSRAYRLACRSVKFAEALCHTVICGLFRCKGHFMSFKFDLFNVVDYICLRFLSKVFHLFFYVLLLSF